jgi:hypothetical protein
MDNGTTRFFLRQRIEKRAPGRDIVIGVLGFHQFLSRCNRLTQRSPSLPAIALDPSQVDFRTCHGSFIPTV